MPRYYRILNLGFDYKDDFHKLGMQYQVTVAVTVDAVVVTTIIISTIKGCRSE
jgi:hypothetical protein